MQSYARALALAPTAFRMFAMPRFARLRAVYPTSPNAAIPGRALHDPSMQFIAFPELHGDSIAFTPMPLVAGRVMDVSMMPASRAVAAQRAARQLRDRGVPVDLLLAGEPDPGNPAAVPESAVREWVSEGLVQWLGHVDDMPALFRSVDIVVLPSYREGLPKGLIEAGASGCALVTTDVPGCREVVAHERDGLLVPARNAVALADAIERLAGDSALRARLAAAAREKAVVEFDERIVIERTLEVYRELLPAL